MHAGVALTPNAPKRTQRAGTGSVAPPKGEVVDFAEERKIQEAAEQLGQVRDGKAPLHALMSLLIGPFISERDR